MYFVHILKIQPLFKSRKCLYVMMAHMSCKVQEYFSEYRRTMSKDKFTIVLF